MRWGYIVPRVTLVAGIWAFLAFGFDPTLRMVAISSLQSAVGARVDMGALKTGFAPLGMQVTDVKIANAQVPGTNLIEFETLTLDLSSQGLARKSLIVDEGDVTGLRWGTARQDSGLLPGVPAPEKADASSSASTKETLAGDLQARGAALFGDVTGHVNAALDPKQFETVRMGPELEKKWSDNFTRLEAEAEDLKNEIDEIQHLAQSNSGNKLERLEAYRKAAVESQDALQKIKHLRAEVEEEKQQSRTDFAAFNAARERDQARIREQAALFQSDPQEIAEFLLGPELHKRMNEMVDWLKWSRASYRRLAHDPAPIRSRGETIEFIHHAPLPRVLIRTLNLAGQGVVQDNPLEFTGTLTGLTTNPVLFGQPAILKLQATGPAQVEIKVVFDYTSPTAEPTHEIELSFATTTVPPLDLGEEKTLAVKVAAERLVCRAHLTLVGEALNGTLEFTEEPARLTAALGTDLKGLPPQLAESLHDLFSAIGELKGELHISGELEQPRAALKSSLGDQVAGGLKTALTHQLDHGREELETRLNTQVAQQTDRLKELFRQKSQALTSQLNLHEQQVTQFLQQAAGGKLAELDVLKKGSNPPKGADVKKAGAEIQGELKKLFR